MLEWIAAITAATLVMLNLPKQRQPRKAILRDLPLLIFGGACLSVPFWIAIHFLVKYW